LKTNPEVAAAKDDLDAHVNKCQKILNS